MGKKIVNPTLWDQVGKDREDSLGVYNIIKGCTQLFVKFLYTGYQGLGSLDEQA